MKFLGRDSNGLHEAAFVLGVSAILSQILAFIRDRMLASLFGAGEVLDVYYASFRIPDLIYVFIASLVATGILIPLIIEKRTHGSARETREFLNSILSVFMLLLFFVSLCAYVLIPLCASKLVPGFSVEMRDSFIALSRILLLSPLFLGLSNLIGSITQSSRRFFLYALTPIVYNAGIIMGILFLYPSFGMEGLAYGVILGAFLHFFIQVPFVWYEGLLPFPTLRIRFRDIKSVALLSLPRTLSLSITNIVIIIFTAIASGLSEGSVTVFNLAYNLGNVPLAVIGVSYSVAAFPTLARLFSNGERSEFVRYVVRAGKHIIFWSLSVLALFVVLRAQIVRSILGAGAFDWADTRLTAAALALFSFSVAAQGLLLLLVRGYYAAGNTKKPLIINFVAGGISICAAYIFLRLFDTVYGFRIFFEELFRVQGFSGTKMLMLPLAFSLGAIANVVLLWAAFKKDFREHYVSIRMSVTGSIAGALVMGIVAYFLLRIFDDTFDVNTFVGIFSQGFFSGLGAIAVGGIFYEFIGHKEFIDFRKSITRRIWKTKPIIPEPEVL